MKPILDGIKRFRETPAGRWVEFGVVANLAWLIIQCLARTVRVTRPGFVKRDSVVYAFYHGEQFLLVRVHQADRLTIMTSLSRDGELQTAILRKFGYDIVRGSPKKGFTSGTIGLLDKLEKDMRTVALAVDGPKGPGFRVKPGAVYLAQKAGVPLVPVRVVVKRAWVLHNWDRYIIPKPFTSAEVRYGDPVTIPPERSLKDATKDIESRMQQLLNETPLPQGG